MTALVGIGYEASRLRECAYIAIQKLLMESRF